MFWFILLVIVVAGFVAWKMRAPLLAKILGQDRSRIDRQLNRRKRAEPAGPSVALVETRGSPLRHRHRGLDRLDQRPGSRQARPANGSTSDRVRPQSTSSLARISSNFSAARWARSSTWRANAVRWGLRTKYDAMPLTRNATTSTHMIGADPAIA